MLGEGDSKRQPVLDMDVCLAVHNALQMDETRGQIYELGKRNILNFNFLGGPHVYRTKELMEYFSNVLNHRPKFVKFDYNDFMRLYHAPNSHWEVLI